MGTCLKFVKVNINQIPRYLFEQVKPREFDVDKLYEWAPILLNNPMNLFGAFIDKEENVRGVMWSTFNPISSRIQVHILSVDREYYGKGILNEADGILNKFKKKLGAEKIVFQTTRPRVFERFLGCKKSKSVNMEK